MSRDLTIMIPENSFWKVFKRFGRDEVISLVFNLIGTVLIVHFITIHKDLSDGLKILLISIAGPVIEKLGFYPAHLYNGFKDWIKSKKNNTKYSLRSCLWSSLKNGSISLLEDLIIHDPVYIGLMLLGQSIYSGTPEWILAFMSFVIAVIIVSIVEVGIIELLFKRFKSKLYKKKFEKEKYYESRFYVNSHKINPNQFIQKVSEQFGLDSIRSYYFIDKYYKSKLANFNGRIGKVRERIMDFGGNYLLKKFQLTYTKAGEIPQNVLSQYRFFINEKEKFSTDLEIIDKTKFERYFDPNIHSTVTFKRNSAKKRNGLYVAIDTVTSETGDFSVIELKVFSDVKLIKLAMKYVMDEFNVIQTTQGKSEL